MKRERYQTQESKAVGLSIVIPVYNGALTVRNLVHRLAQLDIDDGLEIVLVDDGSRDASAEVIRTLANEAVVPLTAIVLGRNFGEHNAVMAGLAAATGKFVINIDDDFQNPPHEVKKLYDFARSRPELDVVYTAYAEKQHSPLRNIGSRFANWVSSIVLDKPEGLYLSSFRCINAFVRDCVISHTGPYPYIDGLILQCTQRIGSLQVEHCQRLEGQSNYTLRRLIRLWMAMFINFSIMPLRVSGMVGFLVFALGMLLTLAAVVERIVGNTPSGWASLMAAVLVFSGVQLLMLGIMGEYLGRLYQLSLGKPQFVIREKLSAREK